MKYSQMKKWCFWRQPCEWSTIIIIVVAFYLFYSWQRITNVYMKIPIQTSLLDHGIELTVAINPTWHESIYDSNITIQSCPYDLLLAMKNEAGHRVFVEKLCFEFDDSLSFYIDINSCFDGRFANNEEYMSLRKIPIALNTVNSFKLKLCLKINDCPYETILTFTTQETIEKTFKIIQVWRN